MKSLTKTHFILVEVFSIIGAVLSFLSTIPLLIFGLMAIFGFGYYAPKDVVVGFDTDTLQYITKTISNVQIGFGMLLLFLIVVAIILGILLIKVVKLYKGAVEMEDNFLIENKSRILGWGIFFAICMMATILGFIISIALMIMADNYIAGLIDGRSFGSKAKETSRRIVKGTTEVFVGSDEEKEARMLKKLQSIKQMKDAGLITDEEYEALRKKSLGL